MIHRELCKRGKFMRGFDTLDPVVERILVKSIIKYGLSQIVIFKTKGP